MTTSLTEPRSHAGEGLARLAPRRGRRRGAAAMAAGKSRLPGGRFDARWAGAGLPAVCSAPWPVGADSRPPLRAGLQFAGEMSKLNIDQLRDIATRGTPVICYGLRTDFRSELFEEPIRVAKSAPRM